MTRQRSDVLGWREYHQLMPDIDADVCPTLCGKIPYKGDRRKNRRVGGRLHYVDQQLVILKHETGYSWIRWDELSVRSYRRVKKCALGGRLELLGLSRSSPDDSEDLQFSLEEQGDASGPGKTGC